MPETQNTSLIKEDGDAARDEFNKPQFEKPKLKFVKPRLDHQGDFEQVTAGFFGTFIPQ